MDQPTTPPCVSEPLGPEDFLRRTLAGWDIAFWVLLVAGALLAAFTADDRAEQVGVLVLAGLLGVAYVTIGRPAMHSRRTSHRHLYRLLLVFLIGGLVYLQPQASFLLFIAFPQVWVLSDENREGVAYSVVVVLGVVVAESGRSGWNEDAILGNLPWWLISLLVSIAFGLWISRILDESGARADLIATLERTRAELGEANHAAGVVAERERLAREIHDTLAQGFTGIITTAAAAQALVARGDLDEVSRRLAVIEDIARDNLGEARALVAAFAPLGLDDSTLVEALHRLARRFESETGVRVTVRGETGDEAAAGLPADRQVVLLRAAQEALANVRKHARATQVSILVRTGADGRAEIEVTDDGAGFEPALAAEGGFGLAGMRGRVEDAGGELHIDSAPGSGTLIRVQLPASAGRGVEGDVG